MNCKQSINALGEFRKAFLNGTSAEIKSLSVDDDDGGFASNRKRSIKLSTETNR